MELREQRLHQSLFHSSGRRFQQGGLDSADRVYRRRRISGHFSHTHLREELGTTVGLSHGRHSNGSGQCRKLLTFNWQTYYPLHNAPGSFRKGPLEGAAQFYATRRDAWNPIRKWMCAGAQTWHDDAIQPYHLPVDAPLRLRRQLRNVRSRKLFEISAYGHAGKGALPVQQIFLSARQDRLNRSPRSVKKTSFHPSSRGDPDPSGKSLPEVRLSFWFLPWTRPSARFTVVSRGGSAPIGPLIIPFQSRECETLWFASSRRRPLPHRYGEQDASPFRDINRCPPCCQFRRWSHPSAPINLAAL